MISEGVGGVYCADIPLEQETVSVIDVKYNFRFQTQPLHHFIPHQSV